jgi:hypothetical protein
MRKTGLKALFVSLCLIGSEMVLGLSPVRAGLLSFSAPEKLITLPWVKGSRYGVTAKGAEWLMVDNGGGFWLETDLDFDLYSPHGKYLKTIVPPDEMGNFYGFDGMEVLPDGRILLLERMESRAEQMEGDDFELRSKPGVRLVVFKTDGSVDTDLELVDPIQPHSDYDLESGNVYSVHDDGTYQMLDSAVGAPPDKVFGKFAAVTDNPESWLRHLKTLSVFRLGNRVYYDTKGAAHVDQGVRSFLMGHSFVESKEPLGERNGKIYYQVVYDVNVHFVDSVFVEDSARRQYALIDLINTDPQRRGAHDPALFVDEKGNVFEGVAKNDGYEIYEWKIL